MQDQKIPEEVQAVVVREKLDEQSGKSLIAAFAPYHDQITAALEMSRPITDGENPSSQKVARTCRLELRRIRCDIENSRKTAKADALRYGKAVDGLANVLKYLCEPEERRLEEIEKYAERKEAERIAQIVADRTAALEAVDCDPTAYNLALMDDATFDDTVLIATRIRDEWIEAERKAEADRIAREKAEAEEREKMRAENERLKAEAEAKEKQLAKEREAREKDERDRVRAQKVEAARIEAERAKERAEAEAKAKAEAEAREKERAAERAKIDANLRKIEAERAKERAAYEAEAKAEAAAREKLETAARLAREKAESEAIAKANAERIAAAREADEKHRKAVMNMAYQCIIKVGVEKDLAIEVVKAIAAGKIKNVTMVW